MQKDLVTLETDEGKTQELITRRSQDGKFNVYRANPTWMVAEFNAWRHQHIRPPWWALLDAVFHQTLQGLDLWGRAREYWWRFTAGRGLYLLSILILMGLLWGLVLVVRNWDWLNGESNNGPFGLFEAIATLAATVVALWGSASAVGRSLLFGTARSAQSYVSATRNPVENVRKRFKALIKRRKHRKVAILINDLDRCRSEYVVDLLEGIQTLLRDAPVVYLVAADRQWLNACCEEIYETLKDRVRAPGKSLGTLFLEKTFHLSTPAPVIPTPLKKAYWHGLIDVTPEKEESPNRGKMQNSVQTPGALDRSGQVGVSGAGQDWLEEQARREEKVSGFADPEAVKRTQKALKKFTPLLEDNPRAMKRLVNAYITNKALATLSYEDIDTEPLVLWTILSLRWPQLADALAKTPKLLERLDGGGGEAVDLEIQTLIGEREVRAVIKGQVNETRVTWWPLDAMTVRQCARLRA